MKSNRVIRTGPHVHLLAATFVAGSLMVEPPRVAAMPTSAAKCANAKLKATAKKASDKLACHAKAVVTGAAVDPDCLAKAETKFTRAFTRAELAGGCFTTGDALVLEAVVDAFVSEAAVMLPTGPKRVFVTSTTTMGGFGGLSGGDAICAARASAAGLSGTYKAWLSTSGASAGDRLTHAAVPYELVDGTPIANDWADLVDGTLSAPIDHDEFGAGGYVAGVWTATLWDGSLVAGSTCGDWSSSSSSDSGAAGVTSLSSNGWSAFGYGTCDTALSLYCFEQ
jgi:hypothetical protein